MEACYTCLRDPRRLDLCLQFVTNLVTTDESLWVTQGQQSLLDTAYLCVLFLPIPFIPPFFLSSLHIFLDLF